MKTTKKTHPFTALELEHEGKSKKIWSLPGLSYVAIENTDRLTAYNRQSAESLTGKGDYFAQTSVNCFKLLNRHGIPNHFLPSIKTSCVANAFWASKLKMIPVEFVVRHQAYGSYIKRHPDTRSTEIFSEPVIECFEKDDDRNDPLLMVDYSRGVVACYKPDRPLEPDSLISERPISDVDYLMLEYWPRAASIVGDAAVILRKAWAEIGVTLIDIKFECGIDANNQVLIGDSIDADCWRLWRNNDPLDSLDRQLFKNNCTTTRMLEAYKFILEQTELLNSNRRSAEVWSGATIPLLQAGQRYSRSLNKVGNGSSSQKTV